MTHLTAPEASTWLSIVRRGPSSTMRDFDAYLIAHKKAFVILGDTLIGCFGAVEFLSGTLLLDKRMIWPTYHETITNSVVRFEKDEQT